MVLHISKRPEPVQDRLLLLVHLARTNELQSVTPSYSKNTLRGNPGCTVGPKTPTVLLSNDLLYIWLFPWYNECMENHVTKSTLFICFTIWVLHQWGHKKLWQLVVVILEVPCASCAHWTGPLCQGWKDPMAHHTDTMCAQRPFPK
jgi:hypothetical protein